MAQHEEKGFLRLSQIIGNRDKGIVPIVPVSRSTWLAGVKSGKFPKPVRLSARIVAWKMSDIANYIAKAASR